MGKQRILQLFHQQLRQQAHIRSFIREETPYVVRHVSPFGEPGFIGASNVTVQNAKQVIEEQLSYFKERGQTFEWKLYDYDEPVNLMELLKEASFSIGDQEALMCMELYQAHPLLQITNLEEVHEIKDEQGIRQIVKLMNTVWEDNFAQLGERLWRDKQSNPDKLFLYGVYENGQVVSAAWMYLENNASFASLWGGTTLEGFRQKGYYTKLLAIRAQQAYKAGYQYLTVDASPMSKPILEKCGFDCLAYSYECNSPK